MSDTPIERLRERFPRVAVVHEWLTIPGGSEDVVIELLEMFPKAEAVHLDPYDPKPWPEIVARAAPYMHSYLSQPPYPGGACALPKAIAADD